jgi:hypothetical protein
MVHVQETTNNDTDRRIGPLFIDTFEPNEAEAFLSTSVPIARASLNNQGKADYYWIDVEGHRRQWERKQIGELLSDIDGVEEQLNRELATCDELTLVVEGICMPHIYGVQTYQLSEDKRFFRQGFNFTNEVGARRKIKQAQVLYPKYQAWKQGIRACGVAVIETATLEGTCWEIASAYKYSLDTEHTTFRRYLREHISPFSPDLHVENLMRLKGTGIGLKRAQELIKIYGTFYDAVTADARALASHLGPGIAAKFIEAIGR